MTDLRDVALEQMANGLRQLGVKEDKIQTAVTEAKRLNNDKPLMDLAKPIFNQRRGA